MKNEKGTPERAPIPNESGSKDNQKNSTNEMVVVYDYLKNHVCTASMVAEATGIYQKNICRYKCLLQKMNKLWIVDYRRCRITGLPAQWITTNPDAIPMPKYKQLTLF